VVLVALVALEVLVAPVLHPQQVVRELLVVLAVSVVQHLAEECLVLFFLEL
jgi:hypothetical protein